MNKKKIDFSWFDKEFLNSLDQDYFVSSEGLIYRGTILLSLSSKKKSHGRVRVVFRVSFRGKRYEIGVASCVAAAFLDDKPFKYNIEFKNGNGSICSLDNISLVYLHKYRPKDPQLKQDFLIYCNSLDFRKLFYTMLSRKSLVFKPYFDFDDVLQDYRLHCFDYLDKYDHDDFNNYIVDLFNDWYSKYVRDKIRREKMEYLYLDSFQSSDDAYNVLMQLY